MSRNTKPGIVFAHGIWADGSSFSKVIPALQAEGYEVVSTQNSLETLEGDVAAVGRALGRVPSPAILVGHPYGGTVITAAGGRHHPLRGRQQPRPHALQPQARDRRDPYRCKGRARSHRSGSLMHLRGAGLFRPAPRVPRQRGYVACGIRVKARGRERWHETWLRRRATRRWCSRPSTHCSTGETSQPPSSTSHPRTSSTASGSPPDGTDCSRWSAV